MAEVVTIPYPEVPVAGWAPDYLAVSELAAYLRIEDSDDETELALAISAASRAIDKACDRQFGLVAAPEDRYYTARWDRDLLRWVVPIDDLMTVVGLTVNVDGSDDGSYGDQVTQYAMRPVNAVAKGEPFTSIVVHTSSAHSPNAQDAGVEVRGRFGWTTVPAAVTQACLLQAGRFFQRRDALFGVTGSPQTGGEMRLLAKVDPDVEVVLRPYRKIWGAV